MADTKSMIYLVLAIIILYIFSLPLVFGIKVDVDTDLNVGKISVTFLFIPVFRKKLDIKRLLNGNGVAPQENDKKDEDEKENEKSDGSSAFKTFLKDCALKILKFVCVKNASLYSKIGTGDAAVDGMAVGMLRIMYTQFCAFFGFNGDGGIIEPNYDSEVILFDFFGIFSISFADIIIAVLSVITERSVRLGKGRRRSYANVAE